MDAATGLQPIANHPTVQDRQRRRQSNREAFERALGERGEDAAPADGETAEAPLRPQLQPQGPIGRREDGQRHIDVLA